MQPATLPPWLSPWAGRHGPGAGALYGPRRLKALEYYRARQRSRLTIFTYGRDDSQILRLSEWSGRVNTARPLGAAGAASVGAGVGWEPWERYPLDNYPLVPAAPPDTDHLPGRVSVEWVPPRAPPGGGAAGAGGAGGAGGSLRAWVCGAAVLALLVVLVRALEKCLDIKLLKTRRRSQEWPTPNVRATNRPTIDNGTIIIPGLEDAEPLPAELGDSLSVDLPPPYSECGAFTEGAAGASGASHKTHSDLLHEDPPPPYSDTYVEFSNKNGIPSVLIFSRRRTPLVHRREVVGSDTVPTDDEATTAEQNTENANTEIANEVAAARNAEGNASSTDCVANEVAAARNAEGNASSTDCVDAASANDTTKINTNLNVNADASANDTAVDMNEDDKVTLNDRVVLV